MDGETFLDVSESLWLEWLRGGEAMVPRSLELAFDLDACPEPYLDFNAGADPLVVVTTNPGETMEHQRRPTVEAGTGPIDSTMSYPQAARALAEDYSRRQTGSPAGTRILVSWRRRARPAR